MALGELEPFLLGARKLKLCSECDKKHYAKGLCKKHYDARRTPEHNKKLWLNRQHSMTVQDMDDMWSLQEGCCGVCKNPIPRSGIKAQIDHNHSNICVCIKRKTCNKCRRGLLCPKCNKLLGLAHDDISILLSAIEYLQKYL